MPPHSLLTLYFVLEYRLSVQFSPVTQLHPTLCKPMHCSMPGLPVYHQLPEFTQTLSQWCHPTISSSIVPFSSCLQSFPASESFQISQFFTLGSQSIGVSASASVNTQDWSPLGWTGWISLQSKGLSRVFSNTTVQKHQFSMLSILVIAFLPRSKHLLFHGCSHHLQWFWSPKI